MDRPWWLMLFDVLILVATFTVFGYALRGITGCP